MTPPDLPERVRRLATEARSNVYIVYAEGVPDDERALALQLMAAERDRDRLLRGLEHIHEHEGKVCPQYEICDHVGCASSYAAWSIADGVLRSGEPLGEPFDDSFERAT